MPLYDPERGLISAIQKFSTKDGPGIRDTVFFKGCPLGCLWCSNPDLIRPTPDLLYTVERCQKCGTCIEVCPENALAFGEDGVIVVDRDQCTGCGECVDVCPEGALELVGRFIGVDELVEELLKDRIFYQTSNGGVTFSGGEPLWQSGFVSRAAGKLKEEGIHTALDTAGEVTWCRFEEVLDDIDLVLYDIKAADPELHRQLTGRENDLILANARLLAEKGIPMHIRLVLVPGLNDSPEELEARLEIVRSLGDAVKQIDLLPYHRFGEGKYASLGLAYPLAGLEEYPEECIAELEKLASASGIPVKVGG